MSSPFDDEKPSTSAAAAAARLAAKAAKDEKPEEALQELESSSDELDEVDAYVKTFKVIATTKVIESYQQEPMALIVLKRMVTTPIAQRFKEEIHRIFKENKPIITIVPTNLDDDDDDENLPLAGPNEEHSYILQAGVITAKLDFSADIKQLRAARTLIQ